MEMVITVLTPARVNRVRICGPLSKRQPTIVAGKSYP